MLNQIKTTGASPALVVFLFLHLAVATTFASRGLQQTMTDAKKRTGPPFATPMALNLYASATGSNQGYGFFAPSVASEVRILVQGCNRAKGDWREIDLGIRGEGQQHLSTFLGVGLQSEGPETKAIHDTLSRSLAAAALNRYPDIDTLIVKYQAELIGPLYTPDRKKRQWINVHVFPYYRPNP